MKAPARAAAASLEEIVERFEGRRVAVLADLVVDEFVHGEIARVSREAPVLILEHEHTEIVPGGGANAVANLRALDADPLPIGIVGTDASGRALLDHLRRAGVSTAGVIAAPDHATPTKSRIVAGGVHTRRQQIVRIDRGTRRGHVPRTRRAALARRLARVVSRADGLLIADYGYGAATPELVRGLKARRPATVTVDSRSRVASFRNVTACTPNEEEVERILGLPPLRGRRAVEDAGRELLRRCRSRAVLLTRGPQGMTLLERHRPARHVPAYGSGEVADVTGAGDTVIAVFTLALLAGAGFVEAAVLANYAAGLVVMKAGTATIGRGELLGAIRDDT